MRYILITNDDGILADGLVRLARAAAAFGDVWVVAPDGERSAASHRITLHKDILVKPCDFPAEGVHAFSCSGSPADCVRVGSLGLMPQPPDVVLSGINRGYNAGTDLQYSATAGAAFEGAFQGFPSIAFSEGFHGLHEVTDKYLEGLLEEAMEVKPGSGRIWNINFPECPLQECRGILRNVKPADTSCYTDHYTMATMEDGTLKLHVKGEKGVPPKEGTDLWALKENYVSVGFVNNIGRSNENGGEER